LFFAPGLSLDLPANSSSKNHVVNSISLDSDHPTHASASVMSSKKLSHHPKHNHSSSHHSKHTNDNNKHPSEHITENLSPTSRSDALKKSTKDLQRSSYSLARYQVVLEEVR